MRTRFASALVISLVFLPSLVGAEETVNYGVQPTMSPIYIARALGMLAPIEKKDNVKIVFRNFQNGPIENEAMAAHELQIASEGTGPALVAVSRLPATLIGIDILGQSAILVRSDSDIKTMADLKGKRVGYGGVGTQQYPMMLKALAGVGLKESDITLFKTDLSQIPTLLQQKSIDAGLTYDPYVSEALIGGYARVLLTADTIMPIMQGHYIGNGEYVSNDFLKRRPDVVQDVVDAIVRATDFINKNPSDAAKLWAKEIGIPENVILFSLTKHISIYSRDIAPNRAGIDAYVQLLREAKILSDSDVPKVDPSFANRASAAK